MGADKEKSRDSSIAQFIAGFIACSLWYIFLGVTDPQFFGNLPSGNYGTHWLATISPHTFAFIIALAANFLWGSDFDSGEIALACCSALCAIIAFWVLMLVGGSVWLIVTGRCC